MKNRLIFHYDMNYYYAQILVRDNPELRGIPLIVGAMPHQRGVVCTCSYEARAMGVHSGMSSYDALLKCPKATFRHPEMSKVMIETEKVHKIVKDYSDVIEFIATDEGYLDMTNTYHLFNGKDYRQTAREIQNRILEDTQLTSSIGIGFSKQSAKLASGYEKPMGFKEFKDRKELLKYITDKDVSILYGVGKKMQERLKKYRYNYVRDIQLAGFMKMRKEFGKVGEFIYHMAIGLDERRVESKFEEKGIGNSTTLEYNVHTKEEIKKFLVPVVQQACYRLKKLGKYALTVMLKLKYNDFRVITRAKILKEPVNTTEEVFFVLCTILDNQILEHPVRLVGVRLSNLKENKPKQFNLLDDPNKWRKLNQLDDLKYEIRNKYNDYKVLRDPIELYNWDNTTKKGEKVFSDMSDFLPHK